MFSEITAQYNKLVLNKPDLYKALNDYCKWFNNAIRKFALKFLDYTNSLSESEKEKLKQNLTKIIK